MTADIVVGTLCQEMGSHWTSSAIRGNETPSFPLVVNNQLLRSLALAIIGDAEWQNRLDTLRDALWRRQYYGVAFLLS